MGSFIFLAIVIEIRASMRIRYQVTSEMHLINYEYDTLALHRNLRFGSGVRRVRIALPTLHIAQPRQASHVMTGRLFECPRHFDSSKRVCVTCQSLAANSSFRPKTRRMLRARALGLSLSFLIRAFLNNEATRS